MCTTQCQPERKTAQDRAVLFFDRFPVQSEQFVIREAAGLLREGFPVEIAALYRDFSANMPFACRGIWGNDASPIDRFRSWFSGAYWSAAFSALLKCGIPAFIFILIRPSAFGRFKRCFKDVRIVHSMHAGYAGLAAWVVSRMIGGEFSFSCHARDVFVQNKLLRFLLSKVTRAVVCNRAAYDFAVKLCPDFEHKLRLIHHGAPDLPLRNPEQVERNLIVAIGRPVAKKDYPTLIAAFELVRNQIPDVKLQIFGASKHELNTLPDGAEAMGTVPFYPIEQSLRRASVLAYPSQVAPDGDRDGIPNAILEAMKVGVPVVAANVGSIGEVIEDGVTGLLVPQRDPQSMAKALMMLLDDQRLAASLAHAARQKVDKLFDTRIQLKLLAGSIWRNEH